MVELLIQNSAIFDIDLNVKDIIGWTAFHLACVSGKTSIVEVLMDNSEHFENDLASKDNQGRTGFMLATNSVKDMMRRRLSGLSTYLPMNSKKGVPYAWSMMLKSRTSSSATN